MQLFIGLTLLAAGAIWYDLVERRIPNGLTVGGLAAGLLLRAPGGWSFVGDGAAAAAACFSGGLLLFAVGALGGGDAKLLTAAGAFLGLERLPYALLAIALAGGLLAAFVVARRRAWRQTGRRLLRLLSALLGRPGGEDPEGRSDEPIMIPYGAAIAVGAVAGWWL